MRKINTLDQFVEEDDGFANASDDKKIVVKDFLREELIRKKAHHLSALAEKRHLIQEMMTREDMSVKALEEMQVFKVYPSDPHLEPVMVTFGDMKIAQGFNKKLFVNRYIGYTEAAM
jgi:hypothetical protein